MTKIGSSLMHKLITKKLYDKRNPIDNYIDFALATKILYTEHIPKKFHDEFINELVALGYVEYKKERKRNFSKLKIRKITDTEDWFS